MTKVTLQDVKAVGKVASSLGFFVPSDDQKRLKTMFWSRWKMGPVRTSDEITAASIAQITDTTVVEQWWKDAEFKVWFKNENSVSEEIDHNANIAIETMRQLMYNDNPSIRLKAATESLKAKSEADKAAERQASIDGEINQEQLQKLLNSALAAGIIKLPGGDV